MKKLTVLLTLLYLSLFNNTILAQDLERNVEDRLKSYFRQYKPLRANIGTCKLDSFRIDYNRKKLFVYAGDNFASQPFLPEITETIYQELKQLLPGPVCFYDIQVITNRKEISELIPNIYRKSKKDKSRLFANIEYKGAPWVINNSRPYNISKGLNGQHVALWQSHGKYFINDKKEWGWQRPRLFSTTEDQFTQSFILPYVIPMLQNAGAVVYTPRERDTQKQEVIVDNDTQKGSSFYLEVKSRKARWEKAESNGFAQLKPTYQDGENPFLHGTARYAATERKKDKAFAEWVPEIPETGKYAVYVTYQTMKNSVSDAKYLVFHKGGVTEFKVNQQIGGGTWVYLGTFEFDKGTNDYGMVVLSNESKEKGIVCADAVRFGGGMGNIVRGGSTSGLPRYLEGARYSAQWYGMPYEVYGGRKGSNDYIDDINTRANAVNYLSGGSVYNPTEKGLGVPLEMTLALHSDAGFDKEDDIIGSLAICTTNFNNEKLNAGTNRLASRDLADIMLSQLQNDILTTFNLPWIRRQLWDRNYSETRLPAVPSTIVELLSHQNFADMRLGHDPNFKFTVGRALYKSVLRFLSTQHNKDYIVQPLPVDHFSIRFGKKKNTVELNWNAVNDPLEPTAKPREYIVYTRVGRGGFDNGVTVNATTYTAKIEPGLVYSFKVAAVNHGGESFPSEILSAYKARKERGRVLIINGFDRLSAPAIVNNEQQAGFDMEEDPGVAYLSDISICGVQTGFDRSKGGKEGKGCLGYSTGELEGIQIAGNTFDYPFIHGKAIQAAGSFSFVSCSDESVESGEVPLDAYNVVDLILGLEKENTSGIQAGQTYYKTFSSAMQRALTSYSLYGGNIFVSGAYIGSDMSSSQGNREFTEKILKYGYQESLQENRSGGISGLGKTISIPRLPNERSYAVAKPDCLTPLAPAFSVFSYLPGNQSAGVAFKGDYRTFVMGFPFESIESEDDRASIMASILKFFSDK